VVSVSVKNLLRTGASNKLQMCKFEVNSMVIKMGSEQQLGSLRLEAGGCSNCHDTWQGRTTQVVTNVLSSVNECHT